MKQIVAYGQKNPNDTAKVFCFYPVHFINDRDFIFVLLISSKNNDKSLK